MNMTDEKMDEYMDFYERTFVDDERAETKSRGLPKQLLDMFPTGRPNGSAPPPYSYDEHTKKEHASISQRLAFVVSSLRMRPIATYKEDDDDDNKTKPRIGSFYKRYRRVEDLDSFAKFFHEKVAETVAVKLETLLVAVRQMERKLIRWREARVKQGLEDRESSDSESSTGGSPPSVPEKGVN